ncbi:hypothetical protein BDV30DRAFT_206765 [Aspergillus minisclerotigenes]|uniref:HTH psq-type domain-containing protein n=1 Tax=Aspergillus minisclerotigenes TaxID=656917 RepID=A0A5N6JB95_9EURO|nr:hypothetical protein BDV30DRAFT_206765 [Aspergillus minisclerotigenes]
MRPKLKPLPEMEEQERRIQAAIADIKEGKFSSVREAARKYGVPSTTLRNRMNGVTFRPKKMGELSPNDPGRRGCASAMDIISD